MMVVPTMATSITSYDLVIEECGGGGWTNWESTVHIDSDGFTIMERDNSFNQQYNMSWFRA